MTAARCHCGAKMVPLFTSLYCAAECDKRPAVSDMGDPRYRAWRWFGGGSEFRVPGHYVIPEAAYELKWEIRRGGPMSASEWDTVGPVPDLACGTWTVAYGTSTVGVDELVLIAGWLRLDTLARTTPADAEEIAVRWRGFPSYALCLAWRIA